MDFTDIIFTWFRENLATGALARDTEAYNQAYAALPALIAATNDAAAAGPAAKAKKSNTPPDPAAGDQG